MDMTIHLLTQNYSSTFLGLYILLLMVFIQAIVASGAHRMQEKYIPGIVDEKLSHESFVFRSNRTFLNSLENVPFMFGLVILAVLTGFDAHSLTCLVWIYVIARFVHMILYYKIATEKNPSPRSYFFMIGFLVQLVLFVMLGFSWV
jgi:uncharacterized MAPEG superfamily protein